MSEAGDYNAKQIASGKLTPEHIATLVAFWQSQHDLSVDGKAGDGQTIPSINDQMDKSKVAVGGFLAILAAILFKKKGASATFVPSPGVLYWKDELQKQAPDVPIGFLLSWLTHESAGNPCATGFAGEKAPDGWYKFEAGIGQQYFQAKTPDELMLKTTYGGVSLAMLRAPCVGQKQTRPLSPEERAANVKAFLGEVFKNRDSVRGLMSKAGVSWSEDSKDFWAMVKLFHNLPCIPLSFFVPAAQAGHARSYPDFSAWAIQLPWKEYQQFTTTSGCGQAMIPFFGKIAHHLSAAKKIGDAA